MEEEYDIRQIIVAVLIVLALSVAIFAFIATDTPMPVFDPAIMHPASLNLFL